jgi:hypothetical protein
LQLVVRIAEFPLSLKKFPIDGGTDLFAILDFKLQDLLTTKYIPLRSKAESYGGQAKHTKRAFDRINKMNPPTLETVESYGGRAG